MTIQQAGDLRYHGFSRRGAARPGVSLSRTMSSVIESLERAQLRRVPDFQAGDRVRVHFQVIEGTRRRTQVFEGVVIKRQGHGVRETFTVRKQSFGVGVERTFPVHSPKIERIEVAARGDVRRAKLYYLRDRVGKRARVRERRYTGPEQVVEGGPRLPGGRGDRGGRRVGPDGRRGGQRRGRRRPRGYGRDDRRRGSRGRRTRDRRVGRRGAGGSCRSVGGRGAGTRGRGNRRGGCGRRSGWRRPGAEPEAPGEGEPAPDAEQA